MNWLSAMARKSSLPKRTDRPCAEAYCSAASAASMLDINAARKAVSAVAAVAGTPASLPPLLPFPLPIGLNPAPLSPLTGDAGAAVCDFALGVGEARTVWLHNPVGKAPVA